MNELCKGVIFYFINHILNKIPSRSIRMILYSFLSKGNISRKASIGLGVRILDIRNVKIGNYSNINFDSIIDGRGAVICIGENVDIAPQVNIWSLEHNPNSGDHESRNARVTIGDYCWIANRVTILPGTNIGKHHIAAAGGILKGDYSEKSISMGKKARVVKKKALLRKKKLKKLRMFR
jgi:maltose O-acetyltransferase